MGVLATTPGPRNPQWHLGDTCCWDTSICRFVVPFPALHPHQTAARGAAVGARAVPSQHLPSHPAAAASGPP